jgi:hypothetical protein
VDEIKSVQCVGTNFGKRDFLNLNEKQVVSARTAKSELNEKDSLLAA